MLNRRQFMLAAAALGVHSRALAAESRLSGLVRDGDRVVFLGDSITQQRLYTTYLESYFLTRWPKRKLTFRNSGWGGDTAWLRQRMQGTDMTDARLFMLQGAEQEALLVRMVEHGLRRDVLPLKPDVVLIDFGMNDARRGDLALPVYARAMAELVTQLRKAEVRPVLLTASPEERSQEGQPAGSAYNQMLEKYSAAVRDLAAREKLPFADQFHPYVDLIDRARKQDPQFKTMPDGVHPYPSGHLVMAWGILKGLGAEPLVSEVIVDLDRSRVEAKRARVQELHRSGGGVSFTREDEALPLPLPKEAEVVLPYAPILEDLSRYLLRASGLKAASFDLLVDGQKVETLTAAQLEAGWNLTTANTSMTAQAGELMQKVIEKNNAFFQRWRQVEVPAIVAGKGDDPDVRAKLAAADEKVAGLEAEIDRLRQPKPHRFELRPSA